MGFPPLHRVLVSARGRLAAQTESSAERILPKRKRVPPVVRPSPRRPSTRWDEERRSQLLVMGLGAAVVVVVAVVAIFGYYQTKVRPKGETAIQVGDRSFSLRYLERRLRYDIRELPTQSPEILVTVLNELPNRIAREELMRQGALEKGVDLSEEAIDTEIGRELEVAASADRSAFAAEYRDAVRESGLSTEGYRDVIAAGVAEKTLWAEFQEEVPETAEQVRFRVIVLATEDDAQAALERLQSGEDFAVVARSSLRMSHPASRGASRTGPCETCFCLRLATPSSRWRSVSSAM